MERMLLHVVQAITIAGIVGGYVAVGDLKTQTAVLQSKVEAMSIRLQDFRGAADDRYTGSQARRDMAPLLEKLSDHEERIRDIERRYNGGKGGDP